MFAQLNRRPLPLRHGKQDQESMVSQSRDNGGAKGVREQVATSKDERGGNENLLIECSCAV